MTGNQMKISQIYIMYNETAARIYIERSQVSHNCHVFDGNIYVFDFMWY
jgi:hypothetical protein